MKISIPQYLALCLSVVALGLASEKASAVIVEVDQSHSAVVTGSAGASVQNFYDANMSSVDLFQTSAFGSISGTASSVGGTVNGIRDALGSPTGADINATITNDVYYDGLAGFGTGTPTNPKNSLLNNPTITVNFNLSTGTGGSATGYDLTGLNSFYGWHDQPGFSDQHFNISIAYVAAPTTFISLYDVSYLPFSQVVGGTGFANASEVSLSNLGVSGVAAIKFTFTSSNGPTGVTEQSGQLIREIDVFGTATTVPEPSTFALTAFSLAALWRLQKIRSRRC